MERVDRGASPHEDASRKGVARDALAAGRRCLAAPEPVRRGSRARSRWSGGVQLVRRRGSREVLATSRAVESRPRQLTLW